MNSRFTFLLVLFCLTTFFNESLCFATGSGAANGKKVCIANCALQTGSRDILAKTGVKVRIAKCTIFARSILFYLILFRATYHK